MDRRVTDAVFTEQTIKIKKKSQNMQISRTPHHVNNEINVKNVHLGGQMSSLMFYQVASAPEDLFTDKEKLQKLPYLRSLNHQMIIK